MKSSRRIPNNTYHLLTLLFFSLSPLTHYVPAPMTYICLLLYSEGYCGSDCSLSSASVLPTTSGGGSCCRGPASPAAVAPCTSSDRGTCISGASDGSGAGGTTSTTRCNCSAEFGGADCGRRRAESQATVAKIGDIPFHPPHVNLLKLVICPSLKMHSCSFCLNGSLALY